jgi:hypothetical protein
VLRPVRPVAHTGLVDLAEGRLFRQVTGWDPRRPVARLEGASPVRRKAVELGASTHAPAPDGGASGAAARPR